MTTETSLIWRTGQLLKAQLCVGSALMGRILASRKVAISYVGSFCSPLSG